MGESSMNMYSGKIEDQCEQLLKGVSFKTCCSRKIVSVETFFQIVDLVTDQCVASTEKEQDANFIWQAPLFMMRMIKEIRDLRDENKQLLVEISERR